MKLDPHAIFKTYEDYVSWDRYEEQAELIEGLTDDEMRRLKSGIRYLRGLLGDDFLQRCVEKRNPLLWYMRNAVPHAKRSLIRVAETLKSFEAAEHFSSVVYRLRDAWKTAEVLTVLSAASKFREAGFIVSFDPEVKESRRVPDLRLVDSGNGAEIYVEVSRLKVGADQQHNSDVYFTIWNHVHNAILSAPGPSDITKPRVQPYVRILGSISSGMLPDVIQEIRETIYSTAVDNKYRERSIGNVIEMAFPSAEAAD